MTLAGTKSRRYAVIGAGAAGLATMRALRDNRIEFDCFESSSVVGGHWNTDYRALHMITSRDVSSFPGRPMPDHYPYYPSRKQVTDYLHQFARDEHLLQHIQFETAVERISPTGSADEPCWRVILSDGRTQQYDGVVVATGHLWDPNTPETPGTFSGKVIGSGEYKSVDDLVGHRVLVVGTGNSGCDIAADVAQSGYETFVSMRSAQLFSPKTMFGRPRANLWITRLPPFFADVAASAFTRVIVGRPQTYGMPAPTSWRLQNSPPIVNTQLLHWIQHGRATIVPTIDHAEGPRVRFSDGSIREIDTIVYCTGFKVSLPFLDGDVASNGQGVPLRYGAGILPERVEGLYFIGMSAPRGGQFPVYDLQAKVLAKMLRVRHATGTRLSEEFVEHEEPETEIESLPHHWLLRVHQANRRLDRLARGQSGAEPRTVMHLMKRASDRLVHAGLISRRTVDVS